MNNKTRQHQSIPVRLVPRYTLIGYFFGGLVVVVYLPLRILDNTWSIIEDENVLAYAVSSPNNQISSEENIKNNNSIEQSPLKYNTIDSNATSLKISQEDSSSNGTESSPNSSYLPPTCRFNYDETKQTINRIVFRHMRKAGGSSLRSYFSKVASKYEVDFKIYESRRMVTPTRYEPKTLYVTHLRDPVQRALSHYKYQNRWKCNTIRGREHNLTEADVNMTLQEFIETNWTIGSEGLFNCASNCLSRWVTGVFDHSQMIKMGDDKLRQLAMKEFQNNHLIVVSEWLKDTTYVNSLQNIFGVSDPPLNQNKKMWCDKPTKLANQVVPFNHTEVQEEQIRSLNRVDMDIYQNLTSCQPQFHRQQHIKIRWEVNPNRVIRYGV